MHPSVKEPLRGPDLTGEVTRVAEKKIAPKAAAKKTTEKKSTKAASRVTKMKRPMKRP